MKKILLLGLGKQAIKYIDHFHSRGYVICGVSLSGKSRHDLEEIMSFEELKNKKRAYYSQFNHIIVAISPYPNQTSAIRHLLSMDISNDILIEKPISEDDRLLEELSEKENVRFFIDDIIMDKFYRGIFADGSMINISIMDQEPDNIPHILEHAFGGFLLFGGLESLLSSVRILRLPQKNQEDEEYGNYLFYCVQNDKYNIILNKGMFYLNRRSIGKLDFDKALTKILGLDSDECRTIKKNFIIIRKFLNE